MTGRRKGGRKVKMRAGERRSPTAIPYRDPPDLLTLHALVFPLSLPFGRLPRRLTVFKLTYHVPPFQRILAKVTIFPRKLHLLKPPPSYLVHIVAIDKLNLSKTRLLIALVEQSISYFKDDLTPYLIHLSRLRKGDLTQCKIDCLYLSVEQSNL